jgi:hypothetical protein
MTIYMSQAVYISPPMLIGKTEWCLVVYQHVSYRLCTDYHWRRSNHDDWMPSKKWPSYDGNDTHDGLPRTLLKLWKREALALKKHGLHHDREEAEQLNLL